MLLWPPLGGGGSCCCVLVALNLNLSSTFDLLKCPETSLGSQCGQLSRLLEHIITVCVGAPCQTSRTIFTPLWCMYVAQYFNVTAFLKNSPWVLRDYNHGLGSPLEFPISKYFSQIKYLYFRLFPPRAWLSFPHHKSPFCFSRFPCELSMGHTVGGAPVRQQNLIFL